MKRILYIDVPGFRHLPPWNSLQILDLTIEVIAITDPQAALAVLNAPSAIDITVCNSPVLEVFTVARQKQKAMRTILVTEQTMEHYSRTLGGAEEVLVDHVIAQHMTTTWTINQLHVTIQKILRKNIFGLHQYLTPDTAIHELMIKGSKDRTICNARTMQFAEEQHLGHFRAKLVFGITEELLMNAIYDAPLMGDRHHYDELPRTAVVELRPEEYSRLSFGCDGKIFGIAVSDPFGALLRPKFFQYLKKVLHQFDGTNLIDNKKGGAGLGLFKILYSSHALICNVEACKQTEVIALLDMQKSVRNFGKMARSVHYFD